MTNFDHIQTGVVSCYKPVQTNTGETRYLTWFAVEDTDFSNGTNYVQCWLKEKPYANQSWRMYVWNYKYTAVEPMER